MLHMQRGIGCGREDHLLVPCQPPHVSSRNTSDQKEEIAKENDRSAAHSNPMTSTLVFTELAMKQYLWD